MLLITIILFLVFVLNFILYWVIFLKVKSKDKRLIKFFYKIFPVIWTITIIPIPIINSSFLILILPNNQSYFGYQWIYFALFGVLFVILGINFAKRAIKLHKVKSLDKSDSKLITYGIYRLIRHPIYSAWSIIFLGAAILSDSLICLIFSYIFLFVMEFHAIIEEKLILIPKYGDAYENYKKKTPYRIIPTPFNLILIIITVLIVYVGFLNVN
ncbi:MAG: methyltransferase family protein [Candidatus Thorarchaeota archaeon]